MILFYAWCQLDFSCICYTDDFVPQSLLLLYFNLFYNWRECVMSVLGTTKHS